MIRRLLRRLERAIVTWIFEKAILSQAEARRIEEDNERWRQLRGEED